MNQLLKQVTIYTDGGCDPNPGPGGYGVLHLYGGRRNELSGGFRPTTNLSDLRMALRYYARRMWIEEMFGDMKKHGFDLERTMLRHCDRLSRLTLAVAFLYVWSVSVGTCTIRSGLRHLVDRSDRRDLSIFQIGLRFLDRCLLNGFSVHTPLCSYR